MEAYALGILPGGVVAGFEQHILVCAECQDKMAEMDAAVQAMQAEARAIRLEETKQRRKTKASGGHRSS